MLKKALLFIYLLINIAWAQAPRAIQIHHETIIHGDTLRDNYAWLREKKNPDVINFLYASNAYADDQMKSSATLKKVLYEEMRSHIKENHDSKPRKDGLYWYYTRSQADKEYNQLFRKKDSLQSKEQLVLDLNAIAQEYMYFSLSVYQLNVNQNYLAYAIDSKGNNIGKLFIRDIEHDSMLLSDTIPQIVDMIWANDNATFYYTVPEDKTNRSYRVYRHRLGRSYTYDEVWYEEKDKSMQLALTRAESDSLIFMQVSKTNMTETYYWSAIDSSDRLHLFMPRKENLIYSLQHYSGNKFYIMHNFQAPDYALSIAQINQNHPQMWSSIIAPHKGVLLNSYQVYPQHLVYEIVSNSEHFILIKDEQNNKTDTLKTGINYGSCSFSTEDYHYGISHEFECSVSNLIQPNKTGKYDLITHKFNWVEQDTLSFEYHAEQYETKRLWASSADGTKVPMTIAYKKGLNLNGSNPTLMMGYGSYGNSSFPTFSSENVTLMNRGFIIVQTHIRGGQELGTEWYEKGKLLYKKNTFNDFIACAEYLIAQKYTSPRYLAAEGGSAGGLLMGAVANMRPDLFRCIIAMVPFVDVMNTMLDENIPLTTFEYEEWGNPKQKTFYNYMKSYSPYDNVKAQKYPAMLITAGYDDAQVGYWEPAKWYSKLMDLKTDSNILLLKTTMNGGHQGASGKYNQISDRAFQIAFLMQELGIKENYLTIKGKIVDSHDDPISYANVWMEETRKGTQSNEFGEFALQVKDVMNQTLVVQSLAYEKYKIKIGIKTRLSQMHIVLKSEATTLPTVVVKANATDPALGIIKQAIKHRKENDDRVKTLSCDVYMRQQVRLMEVPKKIPKFLNATVNGDKIDSNDIGLVYLSEAYNHLDAEKHGQSKETMLASKVAGQSQGFSWNRVSDVLMNFYDPTIELSYYSERPFISPIAPLATLSYSYKFRGSIAVDGLLINKIEVIPMRKGEPLFQGMLYITPNDYQIYGADLRITKDANIQFVDTVLIKQEMINMDGVYMPMQLKVLSKIKVFGFEAADVNVARINNYILNPTFPKKFFNYEVFKMEKDAPKKTDQYWKSVRTILLTDEEEAHYRKEDSLLKAHASQIYLDSIDRINNKFKWTSLLIGGYDYTQTSDSTIKRNHFPGIPFSFGFNTVEGLYFRYAMEFRQWEKKGRGSKLWLPELRYGFLNKIWAPSLRYSNVLGNFHSDFYVISLGRRIQSFNSAEPIEPAINLAYSLIDEKNYSKFYYKDFIKAEYGREWVNGLYANFSAEAYNRWADINHSDYSFKNEHSKNYSSNDPQNPTNNLPSFNTHTGMELTINYTYLPFKKYENYGTRKSSGYSNWPEIYGKFVIGKSLQHADYSFLHSQIGLGKNIELKSLGECNLDIKTGLFSQNNNMFFMDYAHFNGNQTWFMFQPDDPQTYNSERTRLNSFLALPYYTFSTNDKYLQMHARYNMRGFILDRLPIIRKLHACEIFGYNSLIQSNLNYNEMYIGMSNILSFIDVYAGKVISDKNSDWFLRFGFSFSLH